MKLAVMLFAVALLAGVPGVAATLTQDGQATSTIVVSDEAAPADKHAAIELADYLEKVTGARLPLQRQPGPTANVYVGRSPAVDALLPEVDWPALGAEGIVIKTIGEDLILAGGQPRGTVYAVYTFLQEIIGCHWYAIDADEVIPHRPTLVITNLDVVYKPPFQYRQCYTEALTDPRFAVKLRQNGREWAEPIPEELGGSIKMGGAHTLVNQFLKPDEHFTTHPDWYALDQASNTRHPVAVCFTSIGAQEQAGREVVAYLDAHPGTAIISVSCPDSAVVCECEVCTALREREGSESGPLLEFVNAVADRVAEKHSQVLVSTLAYWRTDKPPATLKPRPNVLIQLGVLDRNHKHAIPDVPHFSRYVQRWHELTPHFWVWDYDPHFANFIQPHPNHFIAGDSIRFYRDQGVTGIFIQGSWGTTGEFMHLRAWVTAQLMWNPDQDVRALITEFLNAYYGAAAAFLKEYLELINTAINRTPGLWLGVYDATTRHWLTLQDLNTATLLFRQAEAAVATDEQMAHRVRRARLSLDIVWLERYRELHRTARQEGWAFLGPEDPYLAVEEIARNEFKSNTYREWADFGAYVVKLRELFPPRRGKTPLECAGLPSHVWEEFQEERFTVLPEEAKANIVEEATASDGMALQLTAATHDSEARVKLPPDLAGRWRVYVVLRAEAAEAAPAAVVAGIYAWNMPDGTANEVSRIVVPCSPEYQTVDLGVHRLEKDATIQVQPHGAGSYGRVRATWVDRCFLVRAE